jgi:hypothetical protein
MAAVLALLALTQSALLVYEYFAHAAHWPLACWLLLCAAVCFDVWWFKGRSIWFWIGLFL